jgi:Holliday junction resolvase RusA-like endonuclease
VTMKIYYHSRRPDLDESLILDLMQGIVYENDRQVKEKHITWGLDKEAPRAEICVKCL